MDHAQFYQYNDYRVFLRDVLFERQQKNASYSMRQLAKHLALSPGMLSGVLTGNKGLSPERADTVAKHLKMDPPERLFFVDLVLSQEGRTKKLRDTAAARLTYQRRLSDNLDTRFQQIDADTLKALTGWSYWAVIDYAGLDNASSDPYVIAPELGLPVGEVRIILTTLLSLGLVTVTADNQLRKTGKCLTTTRNVPSSAIRRLLSDFLDRAKQSVELDDVSRRDMSVIVVAADSERLDAAKQMIENFRRQLCHFLESGPKKDVLLCLSTQLFNLLAAKETDNLS